MVDTRRGAVLRLDSEELALSRRPKSSVLEMFWLLQKQNSRVARRDDHHWIVSEVASRASDVRTWIPLAEKSRTPA